MIIDDLRNADFSDLGNAPGMVRYVLLSVILILIFVLATFCLLRTKRMRWSEHNNKN